MSGFKWIKTRIDLRHMIQNLKCLDNEKWFDEYVSAAEPCRFSDVCFHVLYKATKTRNNTLRKRAIILLIAYTVNGESNARNLVRKLCILRNGNEVCLQLLDSVRARLCSIARIVGEVRGVWSGDRPLFACRLFYSSGGSYRSSSCHEVCHDFLPSQVVCLVKQNRNLLLRAESSSQIPELFEVICNATSCAGSLQKLLENLDVDKIDSDLATNIEKLRLQALSQHKYLKPIEREIDKMNKSIRRHYYFSHSEADFGFR